MYSLLLLIDNLEEQRYALNVKYLSNFKRLVLQHKYEQIETTDHLYLLFLNIQNLGKREKI